ncbi:MULTISPECIES: DUF6285 domain-containing protein [Actinomadura]|uniref:DUF6285 domain-containing protein n=1 Tax=Actinomadura yumaensis TaxID=111807 RepID=A0ABW2CZF1_9ACTN|nr:DUF6285 domain-containing protein [Actinomadura sp. J1-007]MWK39480.1 hypothetical protein [Actinomadura sp. J1-007]
MARPHDAPSARELVAAVREFLERDVLGGLEGRARFHGLVAVNVLGMVERELDLGPAHERAHAERLAALGFDGDAALAAALREGRLDDRFAEVKAALEDAVRDKLAVADPSRAG